MIDLRSDTVTRPTADMRHAMAEAEVGDDGFGEDPTVRALEEETAERLGTEAAVYVPSGHMANQIALFVSARSGDAVWAHAGSHVLTNEQGASSVLARVLPRTFDDAPWPPVELLRTWLRETDSTRHASPALVCLENTFSGRVIPLDRQRAVTDFARENGLRSHLDGARLWNAAVALGATPAEVAAGFDTVSVCFSKGLGAPVGSALAGDTATIDAARRARKLLGGGMRQVGIIAAGARHALRHHVDRLAEDHERAERLAAGIRAAGLTAVVNTNMVLVTALSGTAPDYAAAFVEHGVACVALGPDMVRLVVHLDIDDDAVHTAIAAIGKAVAQRPQGK